MTQILADKSNNVTMPSNLISCTPTQAGAQLVGCDRHRAVVPVPLPSRAVGTAMARTYFTLGDIEGKLDVLRVECTAKTSFRVLELLGRRHRRGISQSRLRYTTAAIDTARTAIVAANTVTAVATRFRIFQLPAIPAFWGGSLRARNLNRKNRL